MKYFYVIVFLFILSFDAIQAQVISQNYIMTCTMTDNSGNTSIDDIQYYDGLGRPSIHVRRENNYDGERDHILATLQEYDNVGRESKVWLPQVITSDYMTSSSFKNQISNAYSGDSRPFNQVIYENSPLNRVISQYGPGDNWVNHPISSAYFLNSASGELGCKHYQIDLDGTLIQRGNYPSGVLKITQVTDEDGNISYSFKNDAGQLILTRQISNSIPHDTYYVYDIFGNLCFVLPPAYQDNPDLSLYAYQYKYDNRNRCVMKTFPGCTPIDIVYDLSDRPVLTRDGEQRKKGEWRFTLYDILGRSVVEGICHSVNLTSIVSSTVVASFEQLTGSNGFKETGYTLTGIALNESDVQLLNVYYYDNYHFQTLPVFGGMDLLHYVPQRGYGSLYVAGNIEIAAKGKLTGSCCFLLNNSNHKILTMTYYDLWDHIIQQRSTNHLGGVDVDFYWREMTGKLLKHMHSHSAPDKQPLTEIYTYEYDYGERLVRVKHQLNNQSEVVLTENSYDDLGRLQTKKHHGNESLKSTYSYNIRNWLTSIGGLFCEQLTYQPYYNGNINKMSWRFDDPYNMERRYSFYYDGLNRLKGTGYWDEEFNFYDTNYDYDKMGNLLSLSRWGTMEAREDFAKVDDLSFTYNGNQVKSIDDSTEDYITYTPLDFIDNAKEEEEYFYDNNGNLIKDLNKGIDEIQYNCLNLPNYITLRERNATRYLYSADGVKRRKEYGVWELFSIEPAFSSINMRSSLQKAGTGTNSIEFYSFVSNECIDYCGNIIYKNGVLDKVLTEEGYINFVNGAPVYHYYLKDHQGNIRVVMNQNGMKEGLNHYYPFGSLFGEGYDSQQYKYGGKELDKVHGLNWYDFEARYYDSAIGRFHMMDPLCEKYYSVSPYAYCGNNPVNRIDPDGRDWYEDEDGNTMWRRDQAKEHTDDNGKVWKNIGTEYLHIRGNNATLFQQGTNAAGELTLHTSTYKIDDESTLKWEADREAVLGWMSTDASISAAKEWEQNRTLGNWIKFCALEVLGQYTDPMKLVGGASVGIIGYSSMLGNSPKAYAPRVRARGVQDPISHNFPYSFDNAILSTKAISRVNGYSVYRLSGSMNGRNGVYEIGVNKKGIIDHRFFRPY